MLAPITYSNQVAKLLYAEDDFKPSLFICRKTATGIIISASNSNINNTDRAIFPSFSGFALSLVIAPPPTGPFSVPVLVEPSVSSILGCKWFWSSGGTSGICSVSNSFRGSEPEDVLAELSPVGLSAELRLLFAVSEGFLDPTSCLLEIRMLGVLELANTQKVSLAIY